MTQAQKNTALALAVVAGLLSLPLTWMTMEQAQITGGNPFGNLVPSFNSINVDATGLSGFVSVPVKTPFWLIVCVAIVASVLQLVDGSKAFAVPRPAQWATAIVALLWVGLVFILVIGNAGASIGIGALLGLAAAATPVACLACSPAGRVIPDAIDSHNTA